MLTLTDYDRMVYEKELKDFLPDEIIDCHAHAWKKEFPLTGASNGGSTWVSKLSREMLIEDLDDVYNRLFPGKRTTPLVFGSCSRDIEMNNAYVCEGAKKYGYPTLFRTHYAMSADYLEENVMRGGFLGIKPYLSNCPPYIPASEIRIFDFLPKEHLEVANKFGWIVMLHIPRSKRLRDEVNIAQIMEIEEKYPNLKLIVAHIGRAYAKQDIGDAFTVLEKTKNLVFDFTANVCDDAIKACIEAVGTKRLLFGSDLHVSFMRMYRIVDENGVYKNVVPRGLYGDVSGDPHMLETDEKDVTIMMYEQMKALKRVATELKLSDAQIEDILCNNSKRLISEVQHGLSHRS